MEPASADSSSQSTNSAPNVEHHSPNVSGQNDNAHEPAPTLSASQNSSSARNLNFSQSFGARRENLQTEDTGMSFSRLTSGFGLRMLSMPLVRNESTPVNSGSEKPSLIESFTKGFVDSSKTAVKNLQVKARHIVSQNKRRYQVSFFFKYSFCNLCNYNTQLLAKLTQIFKFWPGTYQIFNLGNRMESLIWIWHTLLKI